MNAFDTQIVRKKHGVSWNEEYIIAMIAHNEGISTMRIINPATIAYATHSTQRKSSLSTVSLPDITTAMARQK